MSVDRVAFSRLDRLKWGRTFSDFAGKKILLSRHSKWGDSRLKSSESCCLLLGIK